jgi:pyruvate-formate lyase-activating enzyme
LSCISVGVSIAQAADNKPANSVIAYYFHGNFRCQNCHNMEQWTKELMETCFKDQIDSGKLSFKIINTDKKENQHFMNDYNLYTKSIVLSLVKDGKEVRYENLAKIWDCLRSKQRFQEYVRTEIEKYLKEA